MNYNYIRQKLALLTIGDLNHEAVIREAVDYIDQLEQAIKDQRVSPWISVKEFEDLEVEGPCWIKYKGSIYFAYYDVDHQTYWFQKNSHNAYMAECITYVCRIIKPEPPKDD